MNRQKFTFAFAVLLLTGTIDPEAALAGDGFRFAFSVGGAKSLTTPLTIRQSGEPELDFDATYETRPFDLPIYWAIRAALIRGPHLWELQLLHHKLYLAEAPPEVEHFEITHGYNLLTLHYASAWRSVDWRAGAGVVLPHTESTVRGRSHSSDGGPFGSGYRVTGPALLVGIGKVLPVKGGVFLGGDGQLTAAWANVPVAGGDASAPNVALHLHVGVGWETGNAR